MKTIVIANQKGGSGKSTSTVHLAVAAEQAGDGPVVISDTDPQGSTGDWFNQRKRSGLDSPRYAPLSLSDLTNNLRALKDAGASYLFIDTAPSIGSVNAELFAAADRKRLVNRIQGVRLLRNGLRHSPLMVSSYEAAAPRSG
jgi:chromosome partitioning protein